MPRGACVALALALCAATHPAPAAGYVALANTDACTGGGSCNIARHRGATIAELHSLCTADPRCMCHNERWLKSDCSRREHSGGTTLYMKGAGPFPPPPPPPPPAPPAPPTPVAGFDRIWPAPLTASGTGPPAALSPRFQILTSSTSPTVEAAIARYSRWILPPARGRERGGPVAVAVAEPASVAVASLTIEVLNASEHLGWWTNASYTLALDGAAAVAVCGSPYSAAYALETFAQLVGADGALPHASLRVVDAPQYRHRGLLVDVGRRFYPLALLHDIIDAIAMSKMNVLHMHFSDFPAFRVQSLVYPSLTASLGNQSYSQADVKALVEYARLRGVRVIPEVDVPGHAGGMRSLAPVSMTLAPTSPV